MLFRSSDTQVIAQLDSGYHLTGTNLTYGFPTTTSWFPYSETTGFSALTPDQQTMATMAIKRIDAHFDYGVTLTDATQRIKGFLEKPSWDEIRVNTINAGTYIFEPHVLQHIPRGVTHSLERGLFPHLLERGCRLFGHITRGYWIDIEIGRAHV